MTSVGKKMFATGALSLLVSIPLYALVTSLSGRDGFYILVFCIAVMDLFLVVGKGIAVKSIANTNKDKHPMRIGVVILCAVCFTLLMLTVACALSLVPGPVYDAILSFDEGASTDLTLPIIVWSVCLVADIVLTVVVARKVSTKLNQKSNSQE